MNGTIRRHVVTTIIGFSCFAVTPRVAHGQSAAASAEALFAEGRRLMGEGKIAAACTKFEGSNQLDPSSGTLLNLASCYEKVGRTASAWAAFQEAASLAKSANRAEHLQIAQKRAAALAPLLAKVTVTVAEPVPGLEIRRDGVLVTPAEYGLAVPIDPGPHTYVAKAPHYKTWTGPLNVDAAVDASVESPQPAILTLEVPRLTTLPDEPADSTLAQKDANAPRSQQPSREFWTGRRIGGAVAAGVGGVGIVAGTIFALIANSTYHDSLASCPNDKNLCTSLGVDQRDDARTLGNVATVGFAVGAAALATAAVLFLLPSGDGHRAAVAVHPSMGGLTLRGGW